MKVKNKLAENSEKRKAVILQGLSKVTFGWSGRRRE